MKIRAIKPIKHCGCGMRWEYIPRYAERTPDESIKGFWFPCVCKSGLFVPDANVVIEKIAEDQ